MSRLYGYDLEHLEILKEKLISRLRHILGDDVWSVLIAFLIDKKKTQEFIELGCKNLRLREFYLYPTQIRCLTIWKGNVFFPKFEEDAYLYSNQISLDHDYDSRLLLCKLAGQSDVPLFLSDDVHRLSFVGIFCVRKWEGASKEKKKKKKTVTARQSDTDLSLFHCIYSNDPNITRFHYFGAIPSNFLFNRKKTHSFLKALKEMDEWHSYHYLELFTALVFRLFPKKVEAILFGGKIKLSEFMTIISHLNLLVSARQICVALLDKRVAFIQNGCWTEYILIKKGNVKWARGETCPPEWRGTECSCTEGMFSKDLERDLH